MTEEGPGRREKRCATGSKKGSWESERPTSTLVVKSAERAERVWGTQVLRAK